MIAPGGHGSALRPLRGRSWHVPLPPQYARRLPTLLARLGDIAPERVRAQPPPGTATERDLIRLLEQTDRLYELVDGTLVEKVLGFPEAGLTCDLIRLLGRFLDQYDLGDLAGADATLR